MNTIEQIPDRIKYYLLDWKDRNMDEFRKLSNGKNSLSTLTALELLTIYRHVSNMDEVQIIHLKNKEFASVN